MNHFVKSPRAAARLVGLLLTAAFPLVAAGQATGKPDRTVLPIAEPKRPIYTEIDARNVKAPPRFEVKAPQGAPNVVIVLIDDLGFGVPSTLRRPGRDADARHARAGRPALQQLPHHGAVLADARGAQVRAQPSHGEHGLHHRDGDRRCRAPPARSRTPPRRWPRCCGSTATPRPPSASGTRRPSWEASVAGPFDRWPTRQGFDKFYGFLGGETNQWAPYLYDGVAAGRAAERPELPLHDRHDRQGAGLDQVPEGADARQARRSSTSRPGATHAPHHVPKEWIARWKGKFDQGWDKLREETLARQIRLGVVPPGTKLAPKPPAIKDWDTLSADEKRLFARQAEVFAAFAEYTDHEIGRMLKAFEEVGQADNTLVFYIAGDNGTSGEGGQNGMFNEYTYFNGVQEKVEDMLKRIDQWGGPETYPHMAAGWAVAFNAPFGWMKQVPSDFGGTRNGMVVQLAQGHQGEERDPHAVRPRDRRRADRAAGDRPAGAQGGQRHAADPDGGHEPRLLVRRRQGEGAPHDAVLRDRRQPRDLPRRLVRAHDPQGAVGGQAARHPLQDDVWAALRRPLGLQPGQRPRRAGSRRSWRSCKALFLKEAAKYDVLPMDDRVFERMDAQHGRPSRPDGRAHVADAGRGHDRHDGGRVHQREEPLEDHHRRSRGARRAAATAPILAQGGRFGGWSLYVKDGVPAYDYNFLGLQRTSIASSKPLAPGKPTMRFEFAYDGGGPGKGGMGTLFVNGEKVAEGRIAVTQPGMFSADETADVGIDLGTPVVEAIGAEAKSRFTGRIPKVTIDVK